MPDEAKTGGRDGINLSNLPFDHPDAGKGEGEWVVEGDTTANEVHLPVKWGDAQQYHAEAHEPEETGGVVPKVTLLSMTERPLAVIAAMASMYEGNVVRDLDELSRGDMEEAWRNVLATHLDTPLEAVQLHFLLEGVDRALTHQLVRQRVGAAFAQESLRFAVVDDLRRATTLPPSLAGTVEPESFLGSEAWVNADKATELRQRWRYTWDQAIGAVDDAYRALVESGMPAEEARGLLPQCTATRIHYVTNLRALSKAAGDRLCTQAQFHWRQLFAQMIDAIRTYQPSAGWMDHHGGMKPSAIVEARWLEHQRWQYTTIADSVLFRPVCYQLGRCPMKASFDRVCSIRERVDKFAEHGVPSSQWDDATHDDDFGDGPTSILPAEWLANPGAART